MFLDLGASNEQDFIYKLNEPAKQAPAFKPGASLAKPRFTPGFMLSPAPQAGWMITANSATSRTISYEEKNKSQ
jgi:hypothetical protein